MSEFTHFVVIFSIFPFITQPLNVGDDIVVDDDDDADGYAKFACAP